MMGSWFSPTLAMLPAATQRMARTCSTMLVRLQKCGEVPPSSADGVAVARTAYEPRS